jgi:hypothetical protein
MRRRAGVAPQEGADLFGQHAVTVQLRAVCRWANALQLRNSSSLPRNVSGIEISERGGIVVKLYANVLQGII